MTSGRQGHSDTLKGQRKGHQDSSSGNAQLMALHVTRSPRPSPAVFAYCKQSNTGGGNGQGTRLI